MDTTKVPLGTTVAPRDSYCDPDEIAAFGLAINDDNPMYQDGRAVPPTYAVVSGLPPFLALAGAPNVFLDGGRGGGHGEHDLYIHKVPRPGATLTTSGELSAVVVNKIGMNVFTQLMHTDDDGDLCYEQYWSVVYIGEVTGGNQGRDMGDHTLAPAARSRPVGTMVLTTTVDQTFRYAGASGDRAIIHVSDRAAIGQMGSRGKILQGACTLGIASRALVALAAGGDPNRIRRIAVRFSRNMYPGDELAVSVYALDLLPNGRAAYAFEAVAGGEVVLRNGLVEVDPIPVADA